MSTLVYDGRRQDLAFEKPVGDNPRKRHHVRFWRSMELDAGGRPLGRVGRGTLAAQATSVRVDLALSDLPPAATALGLVVAVEGELDLQLRAVGVQRR